ncbi:Zinc/iron permease [Flagelloscypha sp. PMI_526]|nr:Zinc/iron permease [Flagelloscypha sp. PMI_526]
MITLLIMSALLGAASFAAGNIPLAFSFSKDHITRLSTLGTGLLLGTALGVIIPEGIESVSHTSSELPVSKIAFSLLVGFSLMLIVEQLISPDAHVGHSHGGVALKDQNTAVEFDAELSDLERTERGGSEVPTSGANEPLHIVQKRALPLTFGLIMHALADGLALGVSALSTGHGEGDEGKAESHEHTSSLSLIVFVALIIHKCPTALALSTSLLSKNLPRNECRKHLAVFSASTPLGAIASYFLFSILGAGSSGSDLAGLALLLSGGTFLYVATVLQSVSSPSEGAREMKDTLRVGLIVAGIFIPFVISSLIGHGHD